MTWLLVCYVWLQPEGLEAVWTIPVGDSDSAYYRSIPEDQEQNQAVDDCKRLTGWNPESWDIELVVR
jgi:hypothetical protein